MENHTPTNYNQITQNIWLGTNMCCLAHNATLLKLGFDADLDLEEARPEEPPHTKIYLWLPTPDHQAPTQTQLETGVDLIASLIKQNLKMYLHCKNGHGRAPTLLTAYLMATGLDWDAAFNFIKSKRPVVHLNDVQRAALQVFSTAAPPEPCKVT